MSKLTLSKLMNEVGEWEKEYNRESWRGHVRQIHIAPEHLADLSSDPEFGRRVMVYPPDNHIRIHGILIVEAPYIECWEFKSA